MVGTDTASTRIGDGRRLAAQRTDPRIERSRIELLRAATTLLMEGGVTAVTIDAVVERSGVARTTLYRQWPNRAAVIAAAFGELVAQTPVPELDEPAEKALRQVVRHFAYELAQAPWVALIPAFYAAARTDAEIHEMFVAFVQAREVAFATVVGRAIDAGLLPHDTNIDEAVVQLTGPLVFARLLGRGHVTDRIDDRMVDLLLASRRGA